MNSNVMEVARLNLRGNTMDQGWFKHLTLDNGKPYMVAISVLSEVFYWYKPTEIRDEETNEIRYKQKFKADKLQKSYTQLADTFGFTKRQVKDACDYLKNRSLIKIEFRTIIANGVRCNNVMYVEPVPEEIMKISILYQDPITLERGRVLRSNVPPSYISTEEPPTLERGTNTKITTKTTTKITTLKDNKSSGQKEQPKDNIPYEDIVSYLNEKAGKSFKHKTAKTRSLIKARFKDSFTIDDFKRVIDIKAAQWLNDSHMSQYLRPETLFGTKFESYLNEKGAKNNVSNSNATGSTIPGFKGELPF
ncbi:conserved phage C-terminal domain-containing protein [Bacillus toyonensis]|uniref:conserved phage C-terminal domain-containing protein n=1 Tax=Bacillus toyonensis TaxID=155322 RepID=UPI000BFBD609|nr:conserved phage C-terminal domain-containing protein [Bacillus toyonensis]PHD85513.1 DNA replication protein DnaD [Bacillus toyonensis]